jgi:hypothetical protein
VPKKGVSASPGGEFASLAPGGLVYFYADVKRTQPILAHISLKNIDMKQTLGLLGKVDFLSGAVYPKSPSVPGAPRNILLHAWRQRGRIPGGGVLALSPQWEKTASRTGARYWHSSAYGLSAAIQKTEAFVSDGDPFIDGPPVAAPEKLEELRIGASGRQAETPPALVLGWLENAGTPVNNFLSTLGLPVRIPAERIFFAIHETPGGQRPVYEVSLRIETRNANQARALVSILGLVRGLQAKGLPDAADTGADREFLETLRPLLANPPGVDGTDLLIHTGPMSAEGIALLVNRFAAYSP